MSHTDDDLSQYDYDLPDDLIARHPPAERTASRLMVLRRESQTVEHWSIRDLPKLLRAGDCLVLNDTRVIPARLLGHRAATGATWEGLYLGATERGEWQFIGQTRGKLRPGEEIILHPAHQPDSPRRFKLRLLERDAEGQWTAAPELPGDPLAVLGDFGTVPLPPYLGRDLADASDWDRYQTTFARRPGAVAAPTAGLHFTPELLDECRVAGVGTAFVTLHVGVGTFRPIAVDRLSDHCMHSEWCDVPESTIAALHATRQRGGRIVAVGTTSVRSLESASSEGELRPWSGSTDIFIRPPYRIRSVDALLTNFHLPRSTLLVLVSTFAGTDFIRRAYSLAVNERYRFYSYGDAMLIV
ncbi:MAG: tRNA preQ1(34) S-adenosylmethionine ribosyltransferase-isomerase QueA [Planctomycetales bacterium]|nr:tRNA preQ1(34) S-adenosylmethionine ribosyltransferase-isomerase QueA [Planctomycetales bacterium]